MRFPQLTSGIMSCLPHALSKRHLSTKPAGVFLVVGRGSDTDDLQLCATWVKGQVGKCLDGILQTVSEVRVWKRPLFAPFQNTYFYVLQWRIWKTFCHIYRVNIPFTFGNEALTWCVQWNWWYDFVRLPCYGNTCHKFSSYSGLRPNLHWDWN